MNKLRETLKKELDKRNWNAYDLENRSGVPQPTIHRFLTGKHEDLRSRNVGKIAKALDITESQLRGLEPIPEIEDQATSDNRLPGSNRLMETLSKVNERTVSETERYWLQIIDMCNRLICEGLYSDTEASRRDLFYVAFDLMTRFNYPDISLIENLLLNKVRKTGNESVNHL